MRRFYLTMRIPSRMEFSERIPSNDVVFKIAHTMAAESWWSILQPPQFRGDTRNQFLNSNVAMRRKLFASATEAKCAIEQMRDRAISLGRSKEPGAPRRVLFVAHSTKSSLSS